jgi:hypothetical protein
MGKTDSKDGNTGFELVYLTLELPLKIKIIIAIIFIYANVLLKTYYVFIADLFE